MSFAVFADGSANLPRYMLEGIQLLPCEYTVDGKPETYWGDVDHFDGHAFYEGLKNGRVVRTTLLNTQLFMSRFAPYLTQGTDVIYISMSSGISGTYNAAKIAAEELMDFYKGRFVHIVDSLGCGFGNGLLAVRAAKLSREGVDAREAARILDEEVPHTCQYFTVDDLNFLKNTGRVSGVTAKIATVLNIKPILFGDSTGHIISCSKVRGRKKSIEELAARYDKLVVEPEKQIVGIAEAGCKQDAAYLASLLNKNHRPKEILTVEYEPVTGSHVGPGALALFFVSHDKVRSEN